MPGYYFNLPRMVDLTPGQRVAVEEPNPIAISGGPGTGKSVVSLRRHINNYDVDLKQTQPRKKSLLLTFTTTLAQYLAACCRTSGAIRAAVNVRTSLKGKPKLYEQWDEIIVDEAQDLPVTYYQDIKYMAPVSYGADDSQILYPTKCSTQAELRQIFPDNEEYVLDKNFRNTYNIMQFARRLFPKAVIPRALMNDLRNRALMNDLRNNMGDKPSLMISGGDKYDRTNDKQDQAIIEIIEAFHEDTHNIAILVPWKSDVQIFEEVLTDNNIDEFSVYYEDKCRFPSGAETIKNIHITTFKSAKGLEFDTVIIPNFHRIDEILGQFNTEWKDFYVAVTRTKSNLYLISNYNMPQLTDVADISTL